MAVNHGGVAVVAANTVKLSPLDLGILPTSFEILACRRLVRTSEQHGTLGVRRMELDYDSWTRAVDGVRTLTHVAETQRDGPFRRLGQRSRVVLCIRSTGPRDVAENRRRGLPKVWSNFAEILHCNTTKNAFN